MMMECQQITMLPHAIHHHSSHQHHHQHQHQTPQMTSNHNYQQTNHMQQQQQQQFGQQQQQPRQQQMIPANHHYQHQQSMTQQQQQQQTQHALTSSPTIQYAQVSTAPPTPPSEDGLYSMSPQQQDSQHQVVVQTRSPWVMQQQQQQQHVGQQTCNQNVYSQHNSSNNNNNHNNNNSHNHAQSQTSNSASQTNQQATTIASYYYDIDDEFSDILSAPPTPEPRCVGVTTTGCRNEQQIDHYSNYLPFNAGSQEQTIHNHHHHNHFQLQQEQQQTHQQLSGAYDMNSHYVMSPDSSSLSTTSSSPSDNSVYQQHCHTPNNQPQSIKLELVHCKPDCQQHVLQPSHQHQIQANQQQAGMRLVQTNGPVVQQAAILHQVVPNQLNVSAPHHHHHHHRSSPIHLWEFLKELLQQVDSGCADASVIRWIDKQKGVFKIEDSVRVAKLWGKRKNKPKMNYDKLSRSIRQYYKKGIMKKTDRSQRLVYQFCSAYCH